MKELPGIEQAVNFNSFSEQDRQKIIFIHQERIKAGQAKANELIPGLEETARLYRAQLVAFQDVLTREGFDITTTISKDYAGRIAVLSTNTTLMILGQPKKGSGRLTVMTRIYAPELCDTGGLVYLYSDPTIGERLHYCTKKDPAGYYSSPLRGVAINPRGADGNEREASEKLATGIGQTTMQVLLGQELRIGK